MIHVRTKDLFGGVAIVLNGHSDPNAESYKQACAAVSGLIVPLVALFEGSWPGEEVGGYAYCVVPKTQLRVAEFVLVSLQMLAIHYPQHVVVERTDTQLFTSPETKEWNLAKYPPTAEERLRVSAH